MEGLGWLYVAWHAQGCIAGGALNAVCGVVCRLEGKGRGVGGAGRTKGC